MEENVGYIDDIAYSAKLKSYTAYLELLNTMAALEAFAMRFDRLRP